MKVLQILPELNSGGVERGTLELAAFLVAHGHEAIVVSNGGRQVEALEKSGARHITMPVHRKSFGSLSQIRPFRKLLEKEKPDILHIRSRVPGWIAYLAWRKMDKTTRPRLVSTVHGFYSVNRYSAVMTKGERVIAVSESIRKYILKNYPATPEEKITVIHRGVSPQHFPRNFKPSPEWMEKWRKNFSFLEGKTTLLLPGRITRWKGQEDFIKLITSLRKNGMDVHGLIAGEAHANKRDFEKELVTLCRTCEVEDRVHFLGHRGDLREVMAVSDLVLSLSHDPEAFGRVSLEAAALGKKVVGYGHGGVGEQLSAVFPKGLVTPEDGIELAQICKHTVLSEELPGDIPNAFSLSHMLNATLAIYKDLLTKQNNTH